jgi:hypothetical protein
VRIPTSTRKNSPEGKYSLAGAVSSKNKSVLIIAQKEKNANGYYV